MLNPQIAQIFIDLRQILACRDLRRWTLKRQLKTIDPVRNYKRPNTVEKSKFLTRLTLLCLGVKLLSNLNCYFYLNILCALVADFCFLIEYSLC